MKRTTLFLWLLTIATLWLTACDNSTDYNMSFDEAYDISSHSAFEDMLLHTKNFQQTFDVSTNVDNEWTKIIAKLQANSKQTIENNKSESSTLFDVNINADDNKIIVTWALDIKLVDNVVYLNLGSLDISWSEDVSFLAAMVEWFKNQRLSIPMEWLDQMSSSISSLKSAKELDSRVKEVIINEWDTIYNWRFTQFSGYNARKISLDNEKLQQLINDYYQSINASIDEEYAQETPELNIQNFEWFLVITWKDKVTTVIENMDVIEWEITVNVNGFWGDDYEVNASSDWESILVLTANKRGSNYKVSLNLTDSINLEWIVTPKTSSSKADVKFDVTLRLKSENNEENNIIVPLKGNRTYSPIAEFTVTAPEWAQDLSELLWSYLWSMFWWNIYDDELNYEDNWGEEENYIENLAVEAE